MPPTLRPDGSPCECGRPTGQCVKGDLDRCPTEDDDDLDLEDDLYDDDYDGWDA
jgi:hypothetical protein